MVERKNIIAIFFILMPLILMSAAINCLCNDMKTVSSDAKKAEEYYNQAMEYIQMAQINKAKIMLKKAIELDPESMKINRLYQNIYGYKDIIDYYKKRYEENKGDPKWVYLYYRLLAKEDMKNGCEKIREAEKKFSDYVYLQLASCTCDVGDLNWAGAMAGLNNIIRRKDAPVDAYENLLRLYSLSEKKDQLLPTCREALTRFPDEPSIYKICIAYSEDVISLDEKRVILQKALKQFRNSHQLPEIIFNYARSLNNEAEKMSYLKMLWNKYPSNKISVSVFPILWAAYSKTDQQELIKLAIATLQSDRVGEPIMYSSSIDYILQQWKDKSAKLEELLDSVKVSEFNWQGILILLEGLIKNGSPIKKADAIFNDLVKNIEREPFISKDYLFRAYIAWGKNYHLAKDAGNAYGYFKKALQTKETSMTEDHWLEYIDLLSELKKVDELIKASAMCYVYNLNGKCCKYNKGLIKEKDFYALVREKRKVLYPTPIQFALKAFDGTEVTNSKLKKYNIIYVTYVGSEEIKNLIEKTADELKTLGLDVPIFILLIADSEEEAKEYYNSLGIKVPAMFSPDLAALMKIRGVPSAVILDARGNVLFNKYLEIEGGKDKIIIAMKTLLEEENWQK